jgi:alkylhydroperoxidase family enzyme
MNAQPRVSPPAGGTGHVIRDSALGLVKETVEPMIRLHDRVWHNDNVNPALLELVRLRNARLVNCVFCKNVRYDVAKADGLTEDKVAQIADGYEQSDLSEREKIALVFADAYLKNGGEISAAQADAVRAEFSPQELAHLAIALVAFNAASRCAVSLGGMPEDLPVFEMPLPPAEQ